MAQNVGIALLLTAGAGLATTFGSLLGMAVRRPGPRFMGFTLGFSAGVMVLVSFVELLPASIGQLAASGAGPTRAFALAHVGFFLGMAGIFLIDVLVPHEYVGMKEYRDKPGMAGLQRAGILVAFGVGIHNFPEGMATFAATLRDARVGLAVAVAIAIHNVPEGLAVSAPIYAATGDRRKAFLWSFLSGVSEPVGAAVAAAVLWPFLTQAVLGWMLALVAGVMVVIALDELVPAAKLYGSAHTPITGVIAGMIVMALSLWLLKRPS